MTATKRSNLPLLVFTVLVLGIYFTAVFGFGVSIPIANFVFMVIWFALSALFYYVVCVRQSNRFSLYVKLNTLRAPDRLDRVIVFVFGAYLGWEFFVWHNLKRFVNHLKGKK